jgi:type IV secretory pathway VirD2 relaxase
MRMMQEARYRGPTPGSWALQSDIEQTLRDLSIRSDIFKTMHRAMSCAQAAALVAFKSNVFEELRAFE